MLLIIHNDKRKSRALSDIFYHLGVVSRAISTDEIRDELSEIYRAVVVLDPENITVLSDIKDLASAYNVYIPLFAVSSRVIPFQTQSISIALRENHFVSQTMGTNLTSTSSSSATR